MKFTEYLNQYNENYALAEKLTKDILGDPKYPEEFKEEVKTAVVKYIIKPLKKFGLDRKTEVIKRASTDMKRWVTTNKFKCPMTPELQNAVADLVNNVAEFVTDIIEKVEVAIAKSSKGDDQSDDNIDIKHGPHLIPILK